MFSTCSELTPRAPIPDGRMERIMQPWLSGIVIVIIIVNVNVIVIVARLILYIIPCLSSISAWLSGIGESKPIL